MPRAKGGCGPYLEVVRSPAVEGFRSHSGEVSGELLNALGERSGAPADAEGGQGGESQDLQVVQDRDLGEILEIAFRAFMKGLLAPLRDLPWPGNPRLDSVALMLPGLVPGDDLNHLGPWPDQAHLALENVDELGELIEAPLAEKAAHGGDPGIIGMLVGLATILADVGHAVVSVPGAPSIGLHGAELENCEDVSVPADPLLAEEDRISHREPDGDCCRGHQRRSDHEEYGGSDPVDGRLHPLLVGGAGVGGGEGDGGDLCFSRQPVDIDVEVRPVI